jgi:peptidoglycan hydrolase CwlO-like protein
MKFILLFALTTTLAIAQKNPYGELTAEDQKYYKNEMGQGMNQLERIDSTVKEINKLHAEISSLKADVQILKKEIEQLRKTK